MGRKKANEASIVKYKIVLFYSFAFAVSWTSWFLVSSIY